MISTLDPVFTQALSALKQGDLVVIPTETVYGLAADAQNAHAIAKIFALKQRPSNHPLIVHLGSDSWLSKWARDIPDSARLLARAFWPGPLTMVLTKAHGVLDVVTGNQSTVALRVPNHPVTLQLLTEFGSGLCAPSANRFGSLSPTRTEHVYSAFGRETPLVLEGGQCQVGIESTIIDLSGGKPKILRPGQIEISAIEKVLGISLETSAEASPRVPGALPCHYQPKIPLVLLSTEALRAQLDKKSNGIAVISHSLSDPQKNECYWFRLPARANPYAQLLYQTLHIADTLPIETIYVEAVPEDWHGIWDRLSKAARK